MGFQKIRDDWTHRFALRSLRFPIKEREKVSNKGYGRSFLLLPEKKGAIRGLFTFKEATLTYFGNPLRA